MCTPSCSVTCCYFAKWRLKSLTRPTPRREWRSFVNLSSWTGWLSAKWPTTQDWWGWRWSTSTSTASFPRLLLYTVRRPKFLRFGGKNSRKSPIAFTKIFHLREQIAKAKEVYSEAKSASQRYLPISGQYSADTEPEMAENYLELQAGPARRRGSFRGSRISSIGHSHSGSVDLMETGSLPSSGFR